MPIRIVVEGLEPIRQRFKQFPQQYKAAIKKTLETSLLIIWENVPAYPEWDSWYQRTGQLGRSLGVDMTGGKMGAPDIYEVKMGSGFDEASFGTNLEYAPQVIGEAQRDPWSTPIGWWTLTGTVVKAAKSKIEEAFKEMGKRLAEWLDKGSAI